ncbi:hypothetical protein Enr13x_44890 [Stieleria neptunia]|uniref:Uncharacterized protein n=1 Tax=Stieleria neptunia TaxID=2527979 RepID=A0A518HUU3_9BACT|nr:hypothetical protein [Stieleria neptunia]QDV44621.1 hypothetical protein Enr13x_44890 [Stieleria neptunia]
MQPYREFRHVKCGRSYVAQGEWYRQLNDPVYTGDSRSRLFCEHCQEAVYPQNLVWADNEQPIDEFLRQRLKLCSIPVRFFRNLWVALALGCLLGVTAFTVCLSVIPSEYNLVIGMVAGGVVGLFTPFLSQELADRLNTIDFTDLDESVPSR